MESRENTNQLVETYDQQQGQYKSYIDCPENSESDSSNEVSVGDAASDEEEEVSLDDELLNDGNPNFKKKIELLAAMVGVDTTEPVIVLTEVVRVLKHLKSII